MAHTPQETELGDLFAIKLSDALPTIDYISMKARNSTETNINCCHSHDFCDANETMAEAFKEVLGRDIDLQSDIDTALWNGAWNYAAVKHLGRVAR